MPLALLLFAQAFAASPEGVSTCSSAAGDAERLKMILEEEREKHGLSWLEVGVEGLDAIKRHPTAVLGAFK